MLNVYIENVRYEIISQYGEIGTAPKFPMFANRCRQPKFLRLLQLSNDSTANPHCQH